eukprot:jgi/Tetstr1/453885/TSEL_040805.t1
MRVPYQQLKQHVTAGPSGMRKENLRCLVGEYAPASGPAADRAICESGNEAERRVAERAVVDNMKETYVSMLAPSQLGVGISADGAARFNAEDKHLVGRPEHVWPALRAFRTPIKASVGLEVRIDKMHAYIADMEAARREAPADMEWPEVDGHHGMPVLNVPLGSPEYVHAYMRGKAEELRED